MALSAPVHAIPGRLRIYVPGLRHNRAFADRLIAALGKSPGVLRAGASVHTGNVLVVFDQAVASLAEISRILRAPVRAPKPRQEAIPASPGLRRAQFEALISGAAVAAVGAKRLLAGPSPAATAWQTYDLAGLITVVAGYPYLRRGVAQFMATRRLNADLLFGAAGLLSLLVRENLVGLAVLFLSSLNHLLAARTLDDCQRTMRRLLAAGNRPVQVLAEAGPALLPPSELRPGQVAVLHAGDAVPADGEVLRGSAVVDQSMLTGESAPQSVETGSRLRAGARLDEGELHLRLLAAPPEPAESDWLERRRSRHAELLEHSRRGGGNRWGTWTTGAVLITGLVTQDWRQALAALIAATPAAAALAAPLPLMTAYTAAARRGILVKSPEALATAARVDTVLFDKTGTLTAGRPAVQGILTISRDVDADALLVLAAAAEGHAFHPFGRAIREAAGQRGLAVPRGQHSRETVGQGAAAEVQHRRVWVGSEALMRSRRVLTRGARALGERLRLQGCSAVYVAIDGRVAGAIGLADPLLPAAYATTAALRHAGITRLGLVTGDHSDTARAVAEELGLHPVQAEVGPQAKAEFIAALQRQGETVALVGDGINDAPGLAAADLGVALRRGGPATLRAADVVVGEDPRQVAQFLILSRQAMEVLYQNQMLAAGLNATGLGLACAGAIGPVAATLWHHLTSLVVLGNSSRLLRWLPT